MATLRTRTVKSSGGDYPSLSAWEAGEQASLTTLDEIRRAECYAMSDTSPVVIDGWDTDTTRYPEIVVAAGERHDGKLNTSKYRLETPTQTAAIDFVENNGRVDGVQIVTTLAVVNARTIQCRGTGEYYVSNVIIKAIWTSSANGIGVNNNSTGTLRIWNSIIYDCTNGANSCFALRQNAASGITYAYNVTVQNCTTGFVRSNGTCVVKNCLYKKGAAGTDGYNGTFDAASTNNASDVTSDAPGSNPSTGAVTFVDEANDDFHLSASDTIAKDLGTDLSADANYAFSDDIDGATRSGTWDIGADEITAGGTTYNDSIGESGTGADSQSSSAVFPNAHSETSTGTDSQSSSAVFVSPLSESGTGAASESAAAVFGAAQSESGIGADDQSTVVTFTSAIGEAGSGLDTPSASAVFQSSIEEAGTGADGLAGGVAYSSSVSESGTGSDSQAASAAFASSVGESGTGADGLASTAVYNVTRSESGTGVDFQTTITPAFQFFQFVNLNGCNVGLSVSMGTSGLATVAMDGDGRTEVAMETDGRTGG